MGEAVRPLKIISGGQTGVDRAAWDVAIELGLDWGGWVPKGRKAEDGRIHPHYDRCREHWSSDYPQRTRQNVDDSQATLVLFPDAMRDAAGAVAGGTLLTVRHCGTWVPCCVFDPYKPGQAARCRAWIDHVVPDDGQLNIAGPRESKCPGIYAAAKAFLLEVLR